MGAQVVGPGEEVTSEEILNAMGFDGYHDGVNYMRAVCVLVVEKARGYFEEEPRRDARRHRTTPTWAARRSDASLEARAKPPPPAASAPPTRPPSSL